MNSRIRLMELAGISVNREEQPFEGGAFGSTNYLGMNDDIQGADAIQGFNAILQNADESDEDVESLESINKRAENLYPGKKYKGTHLGENITESIDYIDRLNDEDNIDLPNLIY